MLTTDRQSPQSPEAAAAPASGSRQTAAMSASGRNGVDSTQATSWGNSLTRSYTRRLKPVRHGENGGTQLLPCFQCLAMFCRAS